MANQINVGQWMRFFMVSMFNVIRQNDVFELMWMIKFELK